MKPNPEWKDAPYEETRMILFNGEMRTYTFENSMWWRHIWNINGEETRVLPTIEETEALGDPRPPTNINLNEYRAEP